VIRLLTTVLLALPLGACFIVAAAVGCGEELGPEPMGTGCEIVDTAADAADSTVIDGMTRPRPRDVPLERVRLRGGITDGGWPVEDAIVRLVHDDEVLATVRTDPDGGYELTVLAEEPWCDALLLRVRDDGGREPEPVVVACGETVLDYDFERDAWVRAGPDR
jgi:hypothetical protein